MARRRLVSGPDPGAPERTAVLAAELRLLAGRLRSVADELASVHGVERRGDDNERR